MIPLQEDPDSVKHYILVTTDASNRYFGIVISKDHSRLTSWQQTAISEGKNASIYFGGSKKTCNRTKEILFQSMIQVGLTPYPRKDK